MLVTIIALERAGRRLLPLAALLNLSLLFPDQAPKRFAVARRVGKPRDLQRQLPGGARQGRDRRRGRAHADGARARCGAERARPSDARSFRARSRVRGPHRRRDEARLPVTARVCAGHRSSTTSASSSFRPRFSPNRRSSPTRRWTTSAAIPMRVPGSSARSAAWLGRGRWRCAQHHERFDGRGYPRGTRRRADLARRPHRRGCRLLRGHDRHAPVLQADRRDRRAPGAGAVLGRAVRSRRGSRVSQHLHGPALACCRARFVDRPAAGHRLDRPPRLELGGGDHVRDDGDRAHRPNACAAPSADPHPAPTRRSRSCRPAVQALNPTAVDSGGGPSSSVSGGAPPGQTTSTGPAGSAPQGGSSGQTGGGVTARPESPASTPPQRTRRRHRPAPRRRHPRHPRHRRRRRHRTSRPWSPSTLAASRCSARSADQAVSPIPTSPVTRSRRRSTTATAPGPRPLTLDGTTFTLSHKYKATPSSRHTRLQSPSPTTTAFRGPAPPQLPCPAKIAVPERANYRSGNGRQPSRAPQSHGIIRGRAHANCDRSGQLCTISRLPAGQ